MSKKTLWLCRTAAMIAVLVALQFVTKPLGQFVTGSCVNMVLVVATLCGGLWCGFTVALISPFAAFLVGVGPALIQIVPAISVGNIVLVLVYAFVYKKLDRAWVRECAAVIAAAVLKFAALYLVVVKLLLPVLGLAEKQVAVMSVMFSWPQLVTALIGGVLGIVVSIPVKKAMKK